LTQTSTSPPRRRRTRRLPVHVQPVAIQLHLIARPTGRRFRVEVDYELDLDRATRAIELHAVELTVDRVEARIGSGLLKGDVEDHPECETIRLHFPARLPAGRVRISLRARGAIRDDLRGLYRGRDRRAPWLATQLCPTDARRFFPCFDEPGFKARYTVRVTTPANQRVVSNSPVASRRVREDGLRTTTFRPTPPLSVYLLAVAIGPFEASRAMHVGPTAIRVLTLPGSRSLGRFALRAAVESLRRLEHWFGMPHPYEKLDLLALPDFAFGAMENAGAVFFRDSVLLLDARRASAEDRFQTAETVAHELAHMWFGNLVTMAWWNDLWLNESFATWMAYEIVHDWQPDWKAWSAFIARREAALELDALRTSHPIAPPVKTAEEAQENFDAITYAKGAAVLRMLQHAMGPARFRTGVRRYVRRHRERTAEANDLWRALESASSLPVEAIVRPWTATTGHPVLTLETGKDGPRHLRQSRFLLQPGRGAAVGHWQIPWIGSVLRTRGRKTIRRVIDRKRTTLDLTLADGDALYANADEAGFFRVDHGEAGSAALLQRLPQLTALERVGWVGHQWALVRAGHASISTLFALFEALRSEQDPDVLRAVLRVAYGLARRVAPDAGEDVARAFSDWIAAGHRDALDRVGLAARRGETLERGRVRAALIGLVGDVGRESECRQACAERAVAHLDRGRALPHGAAEVTLRVAAAANPPGFAKVLTARVRTARSPQERRAMLFALSGLPHPAGTADALRAASDPNLAPAVDRAGLLIALLGSRDAAAATWTHLKANWPTLEREMPPILLARLASELTTALPLEKLREIHPFFAHRPLQAGKRTLRQLSEQTAIARRLKRHAGPELRRLLLGGAD
jgi:puromycin-sensitive aminopeptidase